ncbi:hypothetical protein E3T61_20655 [Cryobacterium lactosi]|uniref:Uncharacterized protein n=1 Tax=Cryobacterium lactosi TaxID=1259202 RepID=A0A4R9BI70_9MICO|nr:hypothetical protein [Cryobacterium lactosi]TFD83725.1 hypothetical protein E3T61_20655 [Cryobacterium lactosi]
MTAVKSLIGRAARKIAPETMRTLEYAAGLRQQGGRLHDVAQRVDDLQARLDLVEHRLAEVDDTSLAVDELRRDSLRIAELTDLVVTTLGALSDAPAGSEPRR